MNLSRYATPVRRLRAPLMALTARLRARLGGKPRAFWLWTLCVFAASLACLHFLYRIAVVLPERLGQDAFYHGRQVTVDLTSGETVGGFRSQAASPVLSASGSSGASALNAAPYEPISEFTVSGPMPRASGSLVAWQYYAKPHKLATGYPHIAIIISDLGMHTGDIDSALRLPPQTTLSLSPYASHVAEMAERLRGIGFETMMDIPMQQADYPYSDPGPYAVLTGASDQANLESLHQALSRFAGYTGGVTIENEIVTGSASQMPILAKEFSDRGILLVYARGTLNARYGVLPFSNVWPFLPADLLNEKPEAASVKEALKNLVALAKKQYSAVGILRSSPASMQALLEWLPSLESEHIELVPLSLIAREKYHIYSQQEEAPPPPPKKAKAEDPFEPPKEGPTVVDHE